MHSVKAECCSPPISRLPSGPSTNHEVASPARSGRLSRRYHAEPGRRWERGRLVESASTRFRRSRNSIGPGAASHGSTTGASGSPPAQRYAEGADASHDQHHDDDHGDAVPGSIPIRVEAARPKPRAAPSPQPDRRLCRSAALVGPSQPLSVARQDAKRYRGRRYRTEVCAERGPTPVAVRLAVTTERTRGAGASRV